jgi:CheY-like chemotaxis protein
VILIVDDFPDGAAALCRLLEREGYRCNTINNGIEALAFIRAYAPELPLLVILDDMMPDLDGVAVLRAIRGDPRIAERPVIFFSAGFDLMKRDEALALGALAWLLKGATGTSDIRNVVDRIGEIYQRVGGVKNPTASSQ